MPIEAALVVQNKVSMFEQNQKYSVRAEIISKAKLITISRNRLIQKSRQELFNKLNHLSHLPLQMIG